MAVLPRTVKDVQRVPAPMHSVTQLRRVPWLPLIRVKELLGLGLTYLVCKGAGLAFAASEGVVSQLTF